MVSVNKSLLLFRPLFIDLEVLKLKKISHRRLTRVLDAILEDGIYQLSHPHKTLWAGFIEHQYDDMGVSIVEGGQGVVFLLAHGVPDLEFEGGVGCLHYFCEEGSHF